MLSNLALSSVYFYIFSQSRCHLSVTLWQSEFLRRGTWFIDEFVGNEAEKK